MYSIRYSKFMHRWQVINMTTGIAQSSWPTRGVALQVSARLNRLASIGRVA